MRTCCTSLLFSFSFLWTCDTPSNRTHSASNTRSTGISFNVVSLLLMSQMGLFFFLPRPCSTEHTDRDSPSTPGALWYTMYSFPPPPFTSLLRLFDPTLPRYILTLLPTPTLLPSFLLLPFLISLFLTKSTSLPYILYSIPFRLFILPTTTPPFLSSLSPTLLFTDLRYPLFLFIFSFAATRQSVEQLKDVADRVADAMKVLMSVCLGTVLCCAVLCCAVLCCAVLYSTLLYSNLLYSTLLYSTAIL